MYKNKKEFAEIFEHANLIAGIAMLCYVSWYLSNTQYSKEKSTPQKNGDFYATAPKKIISAKQDTKKQQKTIQDVLIHSR